MFGEYESESPRVPSPWDSLMPSPRSFSPSQSNGHLSGNLAANTSHTSTSLQLPISPLLLPRLVPEDDSGNIEYKLHLLNPSPARFTRLVTQLKWRLLEGGGQAYYELGVADSGDLVGLERQELESSLDTLEMMAGEIGASVIVVKEIEVPAELAARYEEDAKSRGQSNAWGDARGKRARRREKWMADACLFEDDLATISSMSLADNTETEEHSSAAETGDDEETVMFAIDLELEFDSADEADVPNVDGDDPTPPHSRYFIDLVYKPRPMRKRFHHIHSVHHTQNGAGRQMGKKGQKTKGKDKQHLHNNHVPKDSPTKNGDTSSASRASLRRQARDRRREERKEALLAHAARAAAESTNPNPTPNLILEPPEPTGDTEAGAETLVGQARNPSVTSLEARIGQLRSGALCISVESKTHPEEPNGLTIFVSPSCTSPVIPNAAETSTPPVDRIVYCQDTAGGGGSVEIEDDDGEVFGSPILATLTAQSTTPNTKAEMRSIVEVLVVRKMSMEEGFLDFEGFSFS